MFNDLKFLFPDLLKFILFLAEEVTALDFLVGSM